MKVMFDNREDKWELLTALGENNKELQVPKLS